MLLQSIVSLLYKRLGRVVLPVCAVPLLLLGGYSLSPASGLDSSDLGKFLPVSRHFTNPASNEDDANGFKVRDGNKEHQIRKVLFANNTSSHTGTDAAPADDSVVGVTPSNTAFVENRVPDWNGIWRDTAILFGAQVASIGFLYVMPESFSGWSDESKKENFKNYPEYFVNPVIDDDKFYLNFVLHPYFGATYYIRGRERGLNRVSSLCYSALLSAMYEFGVECIFEKPSIQDLMVTPVAGFLVGEFLFEPLRAVIKRKQELRWYDHAVLVLTDPIGVLSLGIEKMFGIKSTIMVDYSAPHMQNRSRSNAGETKSSRIDVTVHFPLNKI
jgi:hypothetical protein